jgi:hypothetical protein
MGIFMVEQSLRLLPNSDSLLFVLRRFVSDYRPSNGRMIDEWKKKKKNISKEAVVA